MSYLTQYALRRPASAVKARRGIRVDEQIVLNLPDFDGGAHVRVLVEDTSARRARRRRLPSPRLKLRIADCVNEINLEFSVDSAEERENSLHKIGALIASLERFRAGLEAEVALRETRERHVACRPPAAGRSTPVTNTDESGCAPRPRLPSANRM